MTTFDEFLRTSETFTEGYQTAVAEEADPRVRRLLPTEAPFFVNKLVTRLPSATQKWIRSEADERAAILHGCRFDEAIGQYVVDWMEDNCILYEGDEAGKHITIDDWQYEMMMQGYGWLYFDEEWEVRKPGFGWVRRYVVISGWIPKKNCKSPTLAANGLYNFLGDGEQGQKCFSLATTRDQAAISHNHAVQYVRQSSKLSSHCKIDTTSLMITDKNSNSIYTILCGDKGGHVQNKEGINGSLFIDETHVVTQKIMNVVGRAGISRRQPLRVQLSTFGENTNGFGYDQYTLGVNNLKAASAGRPYDYRFLHFEYSIPQDTSVDELRSPDLIDSFIIRSNPTLGRVVRLTEARHDWLQSLRSDTELMRFAMYRLNLWNTGGGSFLAGSDWNRCHKFFGLKDIENCPMVIGVDMSRIRDMTAIVACWAVPKVIEIPYDPYDPDSKIVEREINVPHIRPFFWIPQRSIQQYEGHIDIKELAKQKQLFITSTPVVKPEVVAEKINQLDSRFNCQGVASDQAYSRALSACLASTHGWDVDNKFFLIPQTAANIGPAVEQLQGCVLSQELVHDNNFVMNWQLGNIAVVEDNLNNRRFAKPTKDDYRKIDGWAALVNAFFLLMNNPDLYPGKTLSMLLAST